MSPDVTELFTREEVEQLAQAKRISGTANWGEMIHKLALTCLAALDQRGQLIELAERGTQASEEAIELAKELRAERDEALFNMGRVEIDLDFANEALAAKERDRAQALKLAEDTWGAREIAIAEAVQMAEEILREHRCYTHPDVPCVASQARALITKYTGAGK